VASAVLEHPEARRPPEVKPMVSKTRILGRGLRDEVKRTVLREAVDRFNHELLDDEERQLLLDRIKRLRRGRA
jgi:hypothetical protein